MSDVRAKFRVMAVGKRVDGNGNFSQTEVEMQPVYGPRGSVNATWAKYTPAGSLKMYITNEGACDAFLPGQEWFLDFTLAE